MCVSWASAGSHLVWLSLNSDEFKLKLEEFTHQGYFPVDFEVIVNKGVRSYALVMKKSTSPVKSILLKKQKPNEFKDKWRELLGKGYSPIDIESYIYENRQYFGAIWIKDKDISWVSYRNLGVPEFDLVWNESKALSQIPVDIDGYSNLGKLKFSAIFVDNSDNIDWRFKRKVSYQDFTGHVVNMTHQGFRMIDSSAYVDQGRQNYAVLWIRDGVDWRLEREVEFLSMEKAIAENEADGFGLIDVEVYVTRIGLRYTGIWVKE